jgi:hypothetical protein
MPALIFGPMLQPVANVKKVNFSNAQIYAVMNSKQNGGKVPNTAFPGGVSRLHSLVFAYILEMAKSCAISLTFVIWQNSKLQP